jgi:hypothetical protein
VVLLFDARAGNETAMLGHGKTETLEARADSIDIIGQSCIEIAQLKNGMPKSNGRRIEEN